MLEEILIFLEAGGWVLHIIFVVLLILWSFIFERFYYFYIIYPQQKNQIYRTWTRRKDKTSWFALRIREEEISKLTAQMSQSIAYIKTLVIVSPLLGLTGTVTGMISIFDVISIAGTGNSRLMASGISLAIIPTMAGLVTAISGLYFGSYFEKKCQAEKDNFSENLEMLTEV